MLLRGANCVRGGRLEPKRFLKRVQPGAFVGKPGEKRRKHEPCL